ncbi:MAG: hypothetical protein LBS36_04160, partial [Oscillospiraceae bacterium]|nr:hypothetical protein [Oscillospiraceae bacterium]
MDISEIIITIFLLIAAFILLAIGVVLIFFGKRILRSASKKNIFMDNQDFDKINEDIHKIFDD